jgi:4'-phosphopantetheinyl transferase
VRDAALGAHIGTVRTRRGTAEVHAAQVGAHASAVERYGRTLLSPAEQARLGAYRSRESAERYVITRCLVRSVLAERLGVAPRDIEFSQTERGKPHVAGALEFNLSHSGDLILLAISDGRPVGIDVERRRPVARVDALVARWLTPGEREDVDRIVRSGLPVSEAFLRVWSLKEARLKALGVGIAGAASAPTDHIDAAPLDEVLEPFGSGPDAGFVGAIAFA